MIREFFETLYRFMFRPIVSLILKYKVGIILQIVMYFISLYLVYGLHEKKEKMYLLALLIVGCINLINFIPKMSWHGNEVISVFLWDRWKDCREEVRRKRGYNLEKDE